MNMRTRYPLMMATVCVVVAAGVTKKISTGIGPDGMAWIP
jgi:hypothetical protein